MVVCRQGREGRRPFFLGATVSGEIYVDTLLYFSSLSLSFSYIGGWRGDGCSFLLYKINCLQLSEGG